MVDRCADVAHPGRCWKAQRRGKGSGRDVTDWNEVKPMLKSRSNGGYSVDRRCRIHARCILLREVYTVSWDALRGFPLERERERESIEPREEMIIDP